MSQLAKLVAVFGANATLTAQVGAKGITLSTPDAVLSVKKEHEFAELADGNYNVTLQDDGIVFDAHAQHADAKATKTSKQEKPAARQSPADRFDAPMHADR